MALTDDEIRHLLGTKRHGVGFYAAIIGTCITVLGSAGAVGKWIFTAPTQQDYKDLSTKLNAVDLDHNVLKANVDGIRVDISKIDQGQRDINAKIDRVLEHRR